jgi:cation diffusion facilitator family transporter
MKDCCDAAELAAKHSSQSRVLKTVLVINAVMFVVELSAGWHARSTALLADSLDMLEDALVYGISLYVLRKGIRWQARAAFIKGLVMLTLGIGILGEAVFKVFSGKIPEAHTMAWVSLLALAANVACLTLLLRHRGDDLNMRSTWLCSRNDVIGNVGVLFASAAVWKTATSWPDVVVGIVIASLFLYSAFDVLRNASRELKG